MLKVAFSGGRHYTNDTKVSEVINDIIEVYGDITVLVGDCTGLDALVKEYCIKHDIPLQIYYADWKTQGLKAGPLRNKRILDEDPDLVVIFPGGKGTLNMYNQALSKNIPIFSV